MKVPRFICALMIVWMACALQGVSRPLELLHVVDLQLPERPMGIVPDVRGINGPCVYQHCFVFSAQDQKNGRFNLHYKYMTVEDAYKRKNSIEDYAGDIVVTGCVGGDNSDTVLSERLDPRLRNGNGSVRFV